MARIYVSIELGDEDFKKSCQECSQETGGNVTPDDIIAEAIKTIPHFEASEVRTKLVKYKGVLHLIEDIMEE